MAQDEMVTDDAVLRGHPRIRISEATMWLIVGGEMLAIGLGTLLAGLLRFQSGDSLRPTAGALFLGLIVAYALVRVPVNVKRGNTPLQEAMRTNRSMSGVRFASRVCPPLILAAAPFLNTAPASLIYFGGEILLVGLITLAVWLLSWRYVRRSTA